MSTIARPKRRAVIAIALVAAIGLTGVGAAAAWTLVVARPAAAPPARPATMPVTRGSLSEQTQVSGTLLFDRQRIVAANLVGVVTALAPVGGPIGVGGTLYAVNTRPVTLLHGTVPAWRGFEPGMKHGPDVQQLEGNLKTMGLFPGTPDARFSTSTTAAIIAWQKGLGQEGTGVVERGSIVFADGDVRVAQLNTTIGAEVGGGSEVLTVSSNDKVVHAELKLADQRLAVVGAAVSVRLPDGTTTAGTVAAVGVPTEHEQSGGGTSITVPVTVSLADQAPAVEFQRATVTVGFTSAQRDDALTVPVDALLALDDTTFGVEVAAKNGMTRRIPVKTGLFAAGRVEISGSGISEGVDVVVAER